jgi:DNA-binding transcriptional LysR family regulator
MDAPFYDLNHVDTFVRVVEAQSFTAAARALGVPKSTVSRRVSALEESLGVRLLRRTTRKLSLTEAGASYFDRASRALAAMYEASVAASDADAEPRGTVRLTAPVDLGVDVLADMLTRFAAIHPSIHVDLALSSRRVDLVEEGFDLAVRAGRLDDSSLIARKVALGEGRLFASPAYLERAGAPKKPADLTKHTFVMFRPKHGQMELSLEGPKGVEHVTVKGPLGVDDFSFVRRALLAGAGIGLLPGIYGAHACSGGLVHVLPKYAHRSPGLHVVYPSGRYVPQRVALLRDFLIRELSQVDAAVSAKPAA